MRLHFADHCQFTSACGGGDYETTVVVVGGGGSGVDDDYDNDNAEEETVDNISCIITGCRFWYCWCRLWCSWWWKELSFCGDLFVAISWISKNIVYTFYHHPHTCYACTHIQNPICVNSNLELINNKNWWTLSWPCFYCMMGHKISKYNYSWCNTFMKRYHVSCEFMLSYCFLYYSGWQFKRFLFSNC